MESSIAARRMRRNVNVSGSASGILFLFPNLDANAVWRRRPRRRGSCASLSPPVSLGDRLLFFLRGQTPLLPCSRSSAWRSENARAVSSGASLRARASPAAASKCFRALR